MSKQSRGINLGWGFEYSDYSTGGSIRSLFGVFLAWYRISHLTAGHVARAIGQPRREEKIARAHRRPFSTRRRTRGGDTRWGKVHKDMTSELANITNGRKSKHAAAYTAATQMNSKRRRM